jgi:monofunctional glycosyltransferase
MSIVLPYFAKFLMSIIKYAIKALFLLALMLMVLLFGIVLALKYYPPPTSAFMMQQNILAYHNPKTYARANYHWQDFDGISPNLALAVLASEDQRFVQHSGLDLVEIRNAIHDYTEHGRLRGASTITQQVAKNLFLWGGKDPIRKGLEVGIALMIDALWSKQRILEVYLNIAQFGPATYGAKAGAWKHFKKSPKKLSRTEAAWLAVVLPKPSIANVHKPSKSMKRKHQWVVKQMRLLRHYNVLEKLSTER